MTLSIHNIIAAINPDIYCDPLVRSEVKSLVVKKGHLEAAEKAKAKDSDFVDFDELYYKNPFSLQGFKNPIERHELIYDSSSENLEPVYFWFIDNFDMKQVDKVIDNFATSAGSGFFSEIGQKSTRMQEESMKIFGAVNQVIKSILSIIYDLKEFKLRLGLYDRLKSKYEEERKSALLSLKQVWIDTVDFKRGNTSVKIMSTQFQYVTIIDAFMTAESVKDVEKMDINDRVKRILLQRVGEFFAWVEESERELRKRFEVEKVYLKSQVSAVKLYSRWIKPYLKAARQLEQRASATASLVTAFNTTLFELTLLGQGEYKVEDDVAKGDLPELFKKAKKRKYIPVLIVELKFRSIPERIQQGGYGFRGKAEATFTSYALNEDEIKLLKELMEKDDLGDAFKLVEGLTSESLEKLNDDLKEFLDENKNEGKKMDNRPAGDNPFSSLFSLFKREKKEEKKKDISYIAPDSSIEKVIRSQAIIKARYTCRKLYELYKKTHNMPYFI